ncbi:MAG TPA: hypothetical protein VGP68_25010 [Gemmataceae bacterium]|jgi:hypothetical protein|nr:hypothetical protein [Gemmataceae bacterium]
MYPDIRWITPLYGFGLDSEHIGVPESARTLLQTMANELVGTPALVAIYIPEGTEEVYEPGGMRGRVIGTVRLIKMSSRRKMEDYYYDDWDGSRRWPIGWPCKVAYAPDESECPLLREHVEHLFGPGSFGNYVGRFQLGPFQLEPVMRERLNRDFAQFEQRI